MLILLALLGIVSGIAAPYFLKDDPAADVRHAADRVANTLRNARFRAVSLKRDVYVELEPDGESDFYSVYADHDDDGSASGTGAEIQATGIPLPDEAGGWRGVALPDGITFALGSVSSTPDPDADAPGGALDLPQNPLVFEPRGTVRWPDGAVDPSGTIFVSHADHPQFVHAVVVMPTGSIKTWRYDDGGWR